MRLFMLGLACFNRRHSDSNNPYLLHYWYIFITSCNLLSSSPSLPPSLPSYHRTLSWMDAIKRDFGLEHIDYSPETHGGGDSK